MKKTLILGLVTIMCATAMAETDDYKYMNVWRVTPTTPKSLSLDNVHKITFSEENATVNFVSGNPMDVALDNLNKFTFSAFANGDVNSDGTVDISDITSILSVIFGSTEHQKEADVNADNEVNVADVTADLSIIFGTDE